MHGLIHRILKDLVVEKFGAETWEKIIGELGLADDAPVLQLKQYEDALTVKAVVTTASVLGVSVEGALQVFGGYFVEYVYDGGQLRMLESMGDNLEAFMNNMNHLHYVLERGFRSSNFPYFKISPAPAGSGSGFLLAYSSVRGGVLSPLVEGILPVLAQKLHGEKVVMTPMAPEEGFNATWLVSTEREIPTLGSSVVVSSPSLQTNSKESVELPKGTRGKVVKVDPEGDVAIVFDGYSTAKWVFRENFWQLRVTCEEKRRSSSISFWDLHQMFASSIGCCAADSGQNLELVKASATDTIKLDDMVGGLGRSTAEELDRLARLVMETDDPAELLMRAVPARHVAASWDDVAGLDAASGFWSTNSGQPKDYALSRNAGSANLFVTHCWAAPRNWHQLMGTKCMYGDVKATEMKVIADDVAESCGGTWEEVTLWIDKCCIPQRHALLHTCVELIEDFVQRCDGMVVLLSWNYFSRLWCVYEWAAFLVYHDAASVMVSVDNFLRPGTRAVFMETIESFSMAKAQCHKEADRAVLKEKVAKYYQSEAAFEQFARSTALSVMAANGAKRASRGREALEEDFLPWAELATRLGEARLAEKLRMADPMRWRSEAQKEAGVEGDTLGHVARTWQRLFQQRVDAWFVGDVCPELDRIKHECVRPEVLTYMFEKRVTLRSSRTSSMASLASLEEN